MSRSTGQIAPILVALVLAAGGAGPALAQNADADCLGCHEDASATRADGTPVAVSPARLGASIHGQAALACVDCHQDVAMTELPHPDDLARVDCGSCHGDAAEAFATSAHAEALQGRPETHAASCLDCHGAAHDILPKSDAKSAVNHFNVADTCARCHADADRMRKAGVGQPTAALEFHDSIHGRATRDQGLVVAPNCATCHGAHDLKSASNPESRVARGNIPQTCGSCHQGILDTYVGSVHGAATAAGNPRAAVCTDCHHTHGIGRTDVAGWRLDVLKECGSCHEESHRTYRDSFHGQVTALGFERVATCADCHGAHDILPEENPASRIAAGNRPQTCARCHEGATASFAKFDPHADAHDPERSAPLYYTASFMKMLLAGVFTFFGIHTALWFPREIRQRRQRREQENQHAD